jgi:dimethylargininase
VDGGDVLWLGRRVYVGLSTRTNRSAIDQMQGFLAPFGYTVEAVGIRGCLHLKSAVTQVTEDTLLRNPAWIGSPPFPGMKVIDVDPSEPDAANALMVGETVLYQPCFPRTFERLERAGVRVVPLEASELRKAEGALTCCSLIFRSIP